jgi:choline monooxygenase
MRHRLKCPEVKAAERVPAIDADLAHAWSLPSAFYLDAQIFDAEKEAIFARTWQPVGNLEQLARAGDYFTCEVAGEPLLICRDEHGELHGFYNVCRHRAGPAAQGCGTRKVFRCAYHGWTYGLDGRLISATEFEGVQQFDAAEFGLRALRVDAWSGLLFVNLDEAAEPLVASLHELPRQVERYASSDMKLAERREYTVGCNWKAYIDNYLEGFHLPSVHPGLNREVDYNAYVGEVYTRHAKQWSPIRSGGNGDGRSYQSSGGEEAAYFWVFPNWMLNYYPGNLQLNVVHPLAPDKTLVVFEWYCSPAMAQSEAFFEAVKLADQTQREDAAICEAVQKNLASRSYDRGRYSVTQEKCVHHFHRLYADALRTGTAPA